jgi:hypothetical protein
MSTNNTIRLKVPRQELDHSSFFSTEEAAVDQWIDDLPMANLGQTTRQLYKALSELNQVRLVPSKRIAILEKMRKPLYYVSESLTKHYLNQPLVLPHQARKVADLAQALHTQLASGYTIVATHSSALGNRLGIGKSKDLIALSLHRAITEHSLNLQRHYQLYEQANAGIWLSLHQLYCLARQHKLLDKTIDDSAMGGGTLEANYIRALLLGSCKPNELRQQDFKAIFKPLGGWAADCRVYPLKEAELFTVDLQHDLPPIYSELFKPQADSELLSLNTTALVNQLNELRETTNEDSVKLNDNNNPLTIDLLGHLIVSWGTMSKRTFMRQESDDELQLSVGLSATHHFVSGELSFEALIEERGAKTFSMQAENPFLKLQPTQTHRKKDVWDSPYEANVGQAQVSLESIDFHIRSNETPGEQVVKRYLSRNVKMVNSSAHGYCIEWPSDTEIQLKTGEVVGIKETNSHNWSIAAIRWVSRNKQQQILMGLELISPSAAPYGARIIRKTGGDAEYTRVLVLPEIPAIGQPVTVLTPRVPFKVGAKVVLNQRGREVQISLTRKINTSGYYCQFEFKRMSNLGNAPTGQPADDDTLDSEDEFDSLWSNL